ncbi:hypothetical protein M3Y99_00189600 [Aphelenchoides fujianensis]|nr:hypothetical protein M3Y99_00189600 [Aphelenchoides fujianensis]
MCQTTVKTRVESEGPAVIKKPTRALTAADYERDDIFRTKNPVRLTALGKFEYKMIATTVNVLECFAAKLQGGIYWLFIILPLSILFTRAEAAEELDD